MSDTDPDGFDHERHMRRALELARGATERGAEPFGSVLVHDDEVVATASSRVVTEDDLRRHPELDLAREAARDIDAEERGQTVMYRQRADRSGRDDSRWDHRGRGAGAAGCGPSRPRGVRLVRRTVPAGDHSPQSAGARRYSMTERTYRCSNCLEHAVTRDFDVSHLSLSCDNCGEFAEFVNGAVFDQFQAFEESPPESLDWEQLDRLEKFYISNGIVREGRSIEDFEVEE